MKDVKNLNLLFHKWKSSLNS